MDLVQLTDLVGLYLLSMLYDEFPETRSKLYKDDVIFIIKTSEIDE